MSLTLGTGPLAGTPGGAYNFDIAAASPQHRIYWEPFAPRLRAIVGDRVVLDAVWAYESPLEAASGWPASPRCTGRRPTRGCRGRARVRAAQGPLPPGRRERDLAARADHGERRRGGGERAAEAPDRDGVGAAPLHPSA